LIVPALALATSNVGCVRVPEVVAVQPFASVTVKVYAPADNVCAPVPVYGAVPPITDTVTVPVPPKQAMVPAVEEATMTEGWVIVPETTDVQPLASVTV
jgi:hypothetical protein